MWVTELRQSGSVVQSWTCVKPIQTVVVIKYIFPPSDSFVLLLSGGSFSSLLSTLFFFILVTCTTSISHDSSIYFFIFIFLNQVCRVWKFQTLILPAQHSHCTIGFLLLCPHPIQCKIILMFLASDRYDTCLYFLSHTVLPKDASKPTWSLFSVCSI